LPSFETIQAMADKLNVPVVDFFDFDADTQENKERVRLMMELKEIARSLDDLQLDKAVKILAVLNEKK
jgi:hypothetical protein